MSKYALGIDIGDGESCVTIFNAAQRNNSEPSPVILSETASFISAVAVAEDGGIVIGTAAVNDVKATKKFVRFKSRFLENNPEINEAIGNFAKGLYSRLADALKERKLPELNSGEYEVAIGCPAGWNMEARNRYQRLMEQAGFRKPRLVSESRGALMYGVQSNALGLSASEATISTLVIDIGSSTLDFAWINNKSEAAVSGDTKLGGGLFDEYILRRATSEQYPNSADLMAKLRDYPNLRANLLVEARRLKEDYFTNEKVCGEEGVSHSVPAYAWGRDKVTMQITGEAMWSEIANRAIPELNNDSFVSRLGTALKRLDESTKSNPPRNVLLTGGASRMAFFEDACREAFPKANTIMSQYPELTIAQGLAYCALEDAGSVECAAELRSFVDGDGVESIVQNGLPELYENLADSLTPLLVNRVMHPAIQRWLNGGIDTLEQLEEVIGRQAGALLKSNGKTTIETISGAWIRGRILPKVQASIDAICKKHGVTLKQKLTVNGSAPDGSVGVGTSGLPELNLDFITGVVALVVAIIMGMICGGGGVALIMAGPIGVIIGVAIAIVAVFKGKEWAQANVKKWTIPVAMRRMMRNNLESIDNTKIKDGILSAFTANSNQNGSTIIQNIADGIDKQISMIMEKELDM